MRKMIHFDRPVTRLLPVAFFALMAASGGVAKSSPHHRPQATHPESARRLVRDVVHNELQAQTGTPIYWRYVKIDKGKGDEKTFEVYETKAGRVKKLLAVNGKPLPPAQRREQHQRLEKILQDPSQLQKAANANRHDSNQEQRLLAMLPKAFIFQYDGKVGNFVRLKFRPDPQFHPPTREATVFHHMKGHLLVDPGPKRLAEIDGRLMTEVKFWFGLLGYLDKGGTFLVRQKDVGGGDWKMTQLTVNMKGKALFFKTIGVQENEHFKDYRKNPSDMTLRQAVDRLEKATPPKQTTTG